MIHKISFANVYIQGNVLWNGRILRDRKKREEVKRKNGQEVPRSAKLWGLTKNSWLCLRERERGREGKGEAKQIRKSTDVLFSLSFDNTGSLRAEGGTSAGL